MIDTSSDHRTVLAEAIVPPEGYRLHHGLITTYSLDLHTLLALPAHLILRQEAGRAELLTRPVALLDALQRARDRLTVCCEPGATHAPRSRHLLFSLLEPVIHEVPAPLGGAFHPKLWVLWFTTDDGPDRLRIVIGSRNLTQDQSWDLAVTLDGTLGRRRASNRPLVDFVQWLDSQVPHDHLAPLAEVLRRADWELPRGWESVAFRILGQRNQSYIPAMDAEATSTVVVSPFLGDASLRELGRRTRALTVVSNAHALADLQPETVEQIDHIYALTEAASDTEDDLDRLQGLHAKAYMMKRGWRTRLILGSANATPRALLAGTNVEALAILDGLSSKVGTPEELLDSDKGIGDLLTPWSPPDAAPEEPSAEQQRQNAGLAAQERARHAVARAAWSVRCVATDRGLVLRLTSEAALDLGDITARCWPVTLPSERSVDAAALIAGRQMEIGVSGPELVTGLIAFTLRHPDAPHAEHLVRNLPLLDVPDDRHGKVLAAVLHDANGFLAYLRYVLGDLDSEALEQGEGSGSTWAFQQAGVDDRAVLESLVRVIAVDPERLLPIHDLLDGLADDMVPPGFTQVWTALKPHLEPALAAREARRASS